MNDWQRRVRRHLDARGLHLGDEVVEELANHLEDAWQARLPQDGRDADAFAVEALQRADVPALVRRRAPAPPPPVPEPNGSSMVKGLASEARHTLRLLRRAPGF